MRGEDFIKVPLHRSCDLLIFCDRDIEVLMAFGHAVAGWSADFGGWFKTETKYDIYATRYMNEYIKGARDWSVDERPQEEIDELLRELGYYGEEGEIHARGSEEAVRGSSGGAQGTQPPWDSVQRGASEGGNEAAPAGAHEPRCGQHDRDDAFGGEGAGDAYPCGGTPEGPPRHVV